MKTFANPATDIARAASWWADHGPEVRATSASDHWRHLARMADDPVYRDRHKLGEAMSAAFVRRQGLDRPVKQSKPYPVKLAGNLVDLGDRIGMDPEVGDLGFADYMPSLASLGNASRQHHAEKEFLEFAQAETGMELSEKEYKKLKIRQREIMRQSREIAAKMIAAGEARVAEMREILSTVAAPISEFEADEWAKEIRSTFDPYRHDGYSLFVYWLQSETVEELPKYRRTCLLPYVAAMTRAPKLAALEYFIQKNPFCRFWTFTTGERCSVHEIPARLDWLFSKLNGLNKELKRRWGLQFVLCSTEFGTLEQDQDGNGAKARSNQMLIRHKQGALQPEDGSEIIPGSIQRNAKGEALYHPHAHCVLYVPHFFQEKQWDEIIEFVHTQWKRDGEHVHWDAGKIIQDARECCKYVTKPGDLISLSDLELAAFADATRKRHLVRPMGLLKAEIRDRRENGRVLRRKRDGSRMFWRVALNVNRLTSESDEERAARENLEDAFAFTEECQKLARIEPPSYPGALDGGRVTPKVLDPDVTKVLARIGPAAGPTAIKEPRVIVMTNRATPDMKAVRLHPLVERLRNDTLAEWNAGLALVSGIRVHTGTSTGEASQFEISDLYPPPDIFEELPPGSGSKTPVYAHE